MADVNKQKKKTQQTKIIKTIKKRVRNPEDWHKHKQTRLRIAGKEHLNSKGEVVSERKPGPNCNCRRKCYLKVSEDIRSKIFEGYYSMRTHDEQNAYLFGLIRQVDIRRKRNKESNRRSCTYQYYIRNRGREIQICQTAFKNIHGITEKKVRVLCKKMDEGVMFPSDNRGKNSGNRSGHVSLPPEIFTQIKNHINSIVHTHRLKDFIRVDKITGLEVNLSKMWKDYITTFDPSYVNTNSSLTQSDSEMCIAPNVVYTQVQVETMQQPLPITYSNNPLHQENYFQAAMPMVAHKQPAYNEHYVNYVAISGDKVTYYDPIQQQPISVVTDNTLNTVNNTAFVVVQNLNNEDNQNQAQVKAIKKKRPDKRVDKGPLVKLWRYNGVFHDEINGANLNAIKMRLGMYYTEKDIKVKVNKTYTQNH